MCACVGHCALGGGQCTRHVDHSALVDSSDIKESERIQQAARNIGNIASSSIAPTTIPGVTILQSPCSIWPQKSNGDENHAVMTEVVIVSANAQTHTHAFPWIGEFYLGRRPHVRMRGSQCFGRMPMRFARGSQFAGWSLRRTRGRRRGRGLEKHRQCRLIIDSANRDSKYGHSPNPMQCMAPEKQ